MNTLNQFEYSFDFHFVQNKTDAHRQSAVYLQHRQRREISTRYETEQTWSHVGRDGRFESGCVLPLSFLLVRKPKDHERPD